MDMKEVFAMMKDPSRKEEMLQKVMALKKVITDENGDSMDVIPLGDSIVPPFFFTGKMGMRMQDVSDLPMRPDDVMICSYPKTGTHWTVNLVHYLLKDGPLDDVLSLSPPLIDMFPAQVIEAIPSRRVLATHLTPSSLPNESFTKRTKKILVYRNPKDTVVSLYYQFKRAKVVAEDFKMTWNCFVEHWMKGEMTPMDYFLFHDRWAEQMKKSADFKNDVILVCYEELKRNGVDELRRVAEHLGLKRSDARLQEVLDKCSINNLRSDVNDGKVKSPLMTSDGKSALYRKGIVGDWKSHFTVVQSETMDTTVAEKFNPIYKCLY